MYVQRKMRDIQIQKASVVRKMDEQISNLPEGNFDYENGSLDFSCTKLELTLYRDEKAEGSFRVYGPTGRPTRGRVYSSESRMRCITEEFLGEEEEIFYVFDGTGLEEGDVLKGEFYFISNQGEYYLPFVVTIAYHTMDSSLGVIKNLFHFTNLAKTNWAEALKLFYSPDFSLVFSGSDKQYYQLYKGLSVYRGSEQNMEEFLLSINKKQKIEYLLSEKELRIEDPSEDTEYGFLITRNGWGYTRLTITSENCLLLLQKEVFTDDDFLGNGCRVRFGICQERLHNGKNYDTLQISTPYETYSIVVQIEVGIHPVHSGRHRAKRQLTVQLMEFYQAFRLKKIGTGTWLKETQKLVEQLLALDEKDASARLFQAQLLISQERYNEAQWILDHAVQLLESRMEEEPVLWAYQLYLTTLISRDEAYTNEVAFQVEELYKQCGDWRIAWLLLYLSEEYNKSGSRKWLFLEEQFNRGCTSPVLYIEALLLIHVNPTLFMKLSEFEIQVMHYAARKEVLTQDMIRQLQCLVPREKEFSGTLLEILMAAYKKKPERDTLSAICSLLMKGGKTEPRYFIWYERAVEEGIRLTRLYDYYMLSMDVAKPVPIHKMVLMYFSYHSDLDYERNACLYVDIHKRREELPELYLTYLPQIEAFVEEQVLKRHVNANLAYLYKHFLQERMITEESAKALSSLLFMHQIRVEEERFSKIIVRHPCMKEEASYPISNGTAIVPLYGQDCTILFEDTRQQRYTGQGRYLMEKLILPGKLLKFITGYAYDEIGLNLYLCDSGREEIQIEEDLEGRFAAMLHCEQLEDNYRRKICVAMVHYYYEQDRMEELDAFLDQLEVEDFGSSQRNEIMRFLVLRGMYEKAYSWVEELGTYGLDAKTAVRLIGQHIRNHGMQENPTLTSLGIYAFRKGKYDEQILKYLISFYQGMTKELRDLWKAAASFDVDTYPLSEKIIMQMLFTGSFVGEKMEIFKAYVRGGAKAEVEEAFLSQCAYDYFVKDRIMDPYVFEEMLRVLARGETMHPVCPFAVVKYYAEYPEQLLESQKPLVEGFVRDMLLKQIHLPFLKQYSNFVPTAVQLSDKTIIEYRATPGNKAMIHYVMEKEPGEPGEYKTEEMTDVYGGVCFKEFQLFFGESIQYYIMEESESGSQLTESDAIQKSDIEKGLENSRYNMVNDIAIAQTLQDYDTVDDLLTEYGRMSYMTEKLFRLK